ncbi:MAG: GntR family transcriptional regulator [Erysipelotrichaceae bacterium]
MKAKFQKIFDLIEIDIRDGVYNDTRKLLSEDEYVTKYTVSRDTVRSAIDLLIARGYCYPVQGKGVFLRRHKITGAANLEYIRGLTADLYPRKVTSKILVFTQVPAEGYVAQVMDCPPGTPLTHYERIRYADGEPVCFESLYFITSKVPISQDVLDGSVYEHLRSKLNVNILMLDHMISAIKLNQQEADYLGLQVGDPGLCFENLGMDRKGEIIQFGRTVSHYQRIRNLKMVSYL